MQSMITKKMAYNEDQHYDFITEPPDSCICLICLGVARNPQQSRCCGKIYCKVCLKSLVQRKCPNCRKNLKYFNDIRMHHEIQSLKVNCQWRHIGCPWKGELGDIKEHDKICGLKKSQCQNCKKIMLKFELERHHQMECPERCYQCPWCKVEGKHKHMASQEHVSVCPQAIVGCSNDGCNERVKRCELAEHHDVCPHEVVACTYHNIGCSERMKRNDVDEHENDSMKEHLRLAIKRIEDGQTTAPCVQKMKHFQSLKDEDSEWYSPGFYTSPGGYKICLHMYPSGVGRGSGSHLSCYICFMPGDHDNTLEWPFRGVVTVEVLNQAANVNHYGYKIPYSSTTPVEHCSRVVGEAYGEGYGQSQFLAHTHLYHSSNASYIKDDTVYFRVTIVTESETKPWLAIVM